MSLDEGLEGLVVCVSNRQSRGVQQTVVGVKRSLQVEIGSDLANSEVSCYFLSILLLGLWMKLALRSMVSPAKVPGAILQKYIFNSMHAIDIQVIIVRSEGRNA